MQAPNNSSDDEDKPKADSPDTVPTFSPPDPPKRPGASKPNGGTEGSEGSGEAIPKPAEAFWGNLADPFNNTTIPQRVKNVFAYGEALGRTLSGWRIKALSVLFTSSNTSKVEISVTRGIIKGVGKGLVFVAPLSALVDLANVFRKKRIGTAAFYQNYGMAGLGAIGGILGGAAFDAFGFGILASLGLSGVGVFVIAPLLFGLVGAGILQWAGSILNQQTQPGTFLYNRYPGSFLDRIASRCYSTLQGLVSAAATAWSWFIGLFGNAPKPSSTTQTSSGKAGKRISLKKIRFWRNRRILAPPSTEFRPPPPPRWFPAGIGNCPPPPPPPPPVPVGGVLFQNCHTVLTGINEITGAYWDQPSQSLVLIGKDSEDGCIRNFTLPSMDADHLKVALRAALVGDSLGVSIDAPTDIRYCEDRHHMPPTGSLLYVSYLGGSERTLSGAIFFEADRLMKCLSIGIHNQTRKPFRSNVAGFQSAFDLHENGAYSRSHSWHRFWFVVEGVELKRCSQTGAISFGEVKIALKTELELNGAAPGQVIDPVDQKFAEHLTVNFDQYAKEFPIFARLKELAKISALASFLVNEMIDIDLGDIVNSLPVDVSTPETTPSFLRSSSSQYGTTVYTYMMSGGVDMRVSPRVNQDFDREAARLRLCATRSRLSFAHEWKFQLGGDTLCAKAIPLGPGRKFRPVETDHQFPPTPGCPSLSFQRVYESNSAGEGQFGTGWAVLLPWSLTVLRGSGKRREVLAPNVKEKQTSLPSALVLRHGRSGNTQLYRLLSDAKTNDEPVWVRVISQSVRKDGASFHYDSENTIRLHGGEFVAERSGHKYHFDDSGLLIRISGESGSSISFTWSRRRLMKLQDSAGRGYSIAYSDENYRVKTIQTTDGQTLDYFYSPDGTLKEVQVASKCRSLYGYDMSCRLTEISDPSGAIVMNAAYNMNGEYVSNPSEDTVTLPDGQHIHRVFANNRLAFLTDENGSRVDFSYSSKGNLGGLIIRSRSGLSWKIEYGIERRVRGVLDSVGRTAEFEYDKPGRIVRVTSQENGAMTVQRDDKGRISEIVAPGDQHWDVSYGINGLPVLICGPANHKIQIYYTAGNVSKVKLLSERQPPSFPIGPRFLCSSLGTSFQFGSSLFGEQIGRRIAGRHRIKSTVGAGGQSLTTSGPAGTVKITADVQNQMIEAVEFS